MKRGKVRNNVPAQDLRDFVVNQGKAASLGLLGNWPRWFLQYHQDLKNPHNPREVSDKKKSKKKY